MHLWVDDAYMSKEERKKLNAKIRSRAALATLAGINSAGLAALGHNEDIHVSNYFPSQYFTAKLNNTIKLKGWLGYYKFNEGDLVEVVAEKHTDHYEVYAMLKPSEQIISLIPLCFAGRKHALKRYRIPVILFYLLFTAGLVYLSSDFTLDNLIPAYTGSAVLVIPTILILYHKMINTNIKLVEQIFSVLGWQDVTNIDLIDISKKQVKKLIAQGKYSLEWNNNVDRFIRPHKGGYGFGFFYYDPEMFCKKNNDDLLAEPDNITKIDTELDDNLEDERKE